MEDILAFLANLASPASWVVIIIIGLAMIYLFYKDLSSYKTGHKDFTSVLVSTGVLGTFLGIVIGLWNFDTTNISESVPKLLDGLKTAFLTSIIGMFFAILLSIIKKFKVNVGEDEITALQEISKKLDLLTSVDKELKNVTKGLGVLPLVNTKLDSIDTRIAKEFEENRKYLTQELKTINDSLNQAVASLSKGATEEIIKALEEVIKDFNNNLTEQFGESFKELNAAVLKMIQWQETYKSSVQEFELRLTEVLKNVDDFNKKSAENIEELSEKMVSQVEKVANSVVSTQASIEVMEESYGEIKKISQDLKEVIQTNENQIQNITVHLQSMAKIGEDAGKINKELEGFSEIIKGSLSTQSETLSTMSQHLDTQGKEIERQRKEIESSLEESLQSLNDHLTTLSEGFVKNYNALLERLAELDSR